MSLLNPDFRGADEVIVPEGSKFGWTDGTETIDKAILRELRGAERLQDDMPVVFGAREPRKPIPEMLAKWEAFQLSKGRYAGSFDWTILDEFVTGAGLYFLPQIIGSCVESNTNPCLTIREMYQVVLLGDPGEYHGRNEFGPDNYACYGPFSYMVARKRANMWGSGDGLYCEAMAEGLTKDGRVRCNNPKLLEILKANNVAGDRDFPEPQSAAFYRAMGNGKFYNELKGEAGYLVKELSYAKSAQDVLDAFKAGKQCFVCSDEAITKVGEHKDGFAIHARNPRDSWSHNMGLRGSFKASDGEEFIRESNESWGKDIVYNRRVDEVDSRIKTGRLTIAIVGEIDMEKSVPVAE